MTDEQIKQNAEEYADSIYDRKFQNSLWKDKYYAYIAGAHSRDEEIDGYQTQINMTADALQQCMNEVDKLRNPWMSVEDRLPEKLENDCVSDYVLTRIDGPRHVWYLVNKYNYDIKVWEGCNSNTTHWMHIPN